MLAEAVPGLRTLNGISVVHVGAPTRTTPPRNGSSEEWKADAAAHRSSGSGAGQGVKKEEEGREEEEEEDIREVALTQSDLEAVALLFGATKALDGRMSEEESRVLTDMFDTHIQAVMKGLGSRLEDLDDPFLRQAEILKVKYHLHSKALLPLPPTDPTPYRCVPVCAALLFLSDALCILPTFFAGRLSSSAGQGATV